MADLRWSAAVLVATLAGAPSVRADDARAPVLLGTWTAAERAALSTALAALPAAVRERLPRAVARDARRCDAAGGPEDPALLDASGAVHLCPTADASRVVEALLFGFDREVGWSSEPEWRRLNKWSSPVVGASRPENLAPGGFAEERGRRSPRWDLATFLAASWLEPPDAAGGMACRLMSQARFVREHLAALGGVPVAPARCAAFEEWAELERLADVEVVLAAPSTAMVGSLFGHLFLRLVYRDEDGATPAHLSRTVAFLADNDVPFESDRGYAWKGIMGAYAASLHERPFLDAFREYVVDEGRDLRRWRLALTDAERAALMERIWTAGGAGRYAYYFFRQNCATLMMDVVEDAVPALRAVGHGTFVASPPASTLEVWARARRDGGAPLLEHVPEAVLSFDHEARLASRRRATLEARLVGASPATLAPLFRDARAAAPETRAGAYDRLAARLLEGPVGAPDDLHAWLRDSATLESHLSALANASAQARADAERRRRARAARDELSRALRADATANGDGALAAAVARVADEDREARVVGYRALLALAADPASDPRLAARLRLLALLESEVRYDVARLRREPALRDALLFPEPDLPIAEQAYVRDRAELVQVPVVTVLAPPLRAVQRARQALAATAPPPAEAPAEPAASVAARAEYDSSLPRSGIDQLGVAFGLDAHAGGAPAAAPLLGLGGALYDERLGDHRRFGFPSDTAFVVARSTAWLGRAAGASMAPAWIGYDARLLGYRSLRLPLPEADGGLPLGWELHVDLGGSRARAIATQLAAGWGVLARLFDRGELATHVIAALDLEYVGAFPTGEAPTRDKPQALAAPLALEARAALGSHRSWLAARASATPAAVLAGAPRRLAVSTAGEVEAHVALGPPAAARAHDPALLVRASLLRTTLTCASARVDTEALLALGVELR